MVRENPVYAQERSVRRRRQEAAQKLIAAEKVLRRNLIARAVMIFAVVLNLPGIVLFGNPVSLLSAAACVLILAHTALRVTPRTRELVSTRRSGLRRVQAEYDDAFARMLAFEQGGAAALAEREAAEPNRMLFHCPWCAGPGHWSGFDPHDLVVPREHERQIEGDGEMWIVCPVTTPPRRWRYDPYEVTP